MIRRCIDCNVHEAIQDGNRCRECVARLLRETRPSSFRAPEWVRRMESGRLPAKDMTRAA